MRKNKKRDNVDTESRNTLARTKKKRGKHKESIRMSGSPATITRHSNDLFPYNEKLVY